jgi:hypothetical protein
MTNRITKDIWSAVEQAPSSQSIATKHTKQKGSTNSDTMGKSEKSEDLIAYSMAA